MQLPSVRRITADNVPPEQQGTIENVSYIVNPFMEDVTNALSGNIDFDNLVFKTSTFEVRVNSNGIPIQEVTLNPNMLRSPLGMVCVNVRNTDGSNSIPPITGTPFIQYSVQSNGLLSVGRILNLQENRNYLLTVIFI